MKHGFIAGSISYVGSERNLHTCRNLRLSASVFGTDTLDTNPDRFQFCVNPLLVFIKMGAFFKIGSTH